MHLVSLLKTQTKLDFIRKKRKKQLVEEVGLEHLTREQISCRLVAMALAGVSQRKT